MSRVARHEITGVEYYGLRGYGQHPRSGENTMAQLFCPTCDVKDTAVTGIPPKMPAAAAFERTSLVRPFTFSNINVQSQACVHAPSHHIKTCPLLITNCGH